MRKLVYPLQMKLCENCCGTGYDIQLLASIKRFITCQKCKGEGYRFWIDEIMRPEPKDNKNENSLAMERSYS